MTTVKMRVALAFILLISFAMSFPIEKEPSLHEEEPDDFRDENEENNEVIDRFSRWTCVLNNQNKLALSSTNQVQSLSSKPIVTWLTRAKSFLAPVTSFPRFDARYTFYRA